MSVGTWNGAGAVLPEQSRRRQRERMRILPVMIVAVVAFMGANSVAGFLINIADQASLADRETETQQVRQLETALIDAETGVRGYVLAGGVEYLDPYLAGMRAVGDLGPKLLPILDRYASAEPGVGSETRPFSSTIADLRTSWETAIRLSGSNQQNEAAGALKSTHAGELMDRLRALMSGYLAQQAVGTDQIQRRIYVEHVQLLIINLASALIAIAAMIYGFHSSAREARGRELAIAEGDATRRQVEQLFFMADMLQSAANQEDMNAVLRATAKHMLPGFSGAIYIFNNSRDRLDLSTRWGVGEEAICCDHFTPDACWALKRGNPNLNGSEEGALRCTHVAPGLITLEIPMAARGQLHGLLEIVAEGDEAAARLAQIRPIATAIGDTMSLALSSMALRERLRSQALRDALTGLYNRRFLEETLERTCLDAERRKSPVAAIMIDLDHFKRLNDLHGHAAGDAVLQEVAKAILSCLRGTDVACRYGGEELAVLLPDCSIAMAERKAAQIRGRISELCAGEGLSVTASLGVASIPETSARASELLPSADAALYEAKQKGRDRVVSAPLRSTAQRLSVIEGGPTTVGAS